MPDRTVTIPLDEYEELREFKDKKECDYIKVIHADQGSYETFHFLESKEVKYELEEQIRKLQLERYNKAELREKLRAMSICQFIKWRKR